MTANMADHLNEMECEDGPIATEPANVVTDCEHGVKIRTRAELMSSAIQKTINKCVSSASISDFMKHSVSLSSDLKDDEIRSLHKTYKSQLLDALKEEVNKVLAQESLPKLLDDLDQLSQDSQDTLAWRPSGLPKDDVASHLVPILMKQTEILENILHSEMAEFDKLRQSVFERRFEINQRSKMVAENYQRMKQEADDVTKLVNGLEEKVCSLQQCSETEYPEI